MFCRSAVSVLKRYKRWLKIWLKETHNSFKKWFSTFDGFKKKTVIETGNVRKTATFKSFLHQSYKNTQLSFFVSVFKLFLWEKH